MKHEPECSASYRYCSELARREARNFYVSFLMLPAERRRSMCALYGFMRHTDDLADEAGEPEEKLAALGRWRGELDSALGGGEAAWPGLLAVADTVRRHRIPGHLLHAVIDGVAMDQTRRIYNNFAELSDYCYHVASAVGLCCLHIWGYESEGGRAERLAEACGLALQLTNILRDVREDAGLGRIYLPRDEMARFGVDAGDLRDERPTPQLRELLAFQADRAYGLYDQARMLVPLVDPIGRPVLVTIQGIYRALLDEIVRRDYNVLAGRVSVPGWQKLLIALGALPRRFVGRGIRRMPTPVP
ncbi:MAG: phytoene/squalene synthase family protein [Isosphaeraceae bacterium]